MSRRMTVSALVGGLVLALAPVAGAHAEEANMLFMTRATSGTASQGVVAGDVDGSLTTSIRSRRVSGQRARVAMDWIVAAGDRSFTARLRGVMNFRTRAVRLTGRVTSGYLAGAEASARGRLVGRKMRRFVGSLQLVASPATPPPATPPVLPPPDPDQLCDHYGICGEPELPETTEPAPAPSDPVCHLAECEAPVSDDGGSEEPGSDEPAESPALPIAPEEALAEAEL